MGITAGVTAAASVIGTGTSMMGTFSGIAASRHLTQDYQRIAELEQQAEGVRHQSMVLSGQRQSLEIIRNNQRARAMALNAATNQGAQFGSGLSGGYGQVSGMANTNLLGLSQNLALGQQMFGINSQISQARAAVAQDQGQMYTAQGMRQLGSEITNLGPTFGRLGGGFGFGSGAASPNAFYGSTPGFTGGIGGLY